MNQLHFPVLNFSVGKERGVFDKKIGDRNMLRTMNLVLALLCALGSFCAAVEKPNIVFILCNPAVASPGLQLITAADLKDFWRSDYYGSRAKNPHSPKS